MLDIKIAIQARGLRLPLKKALPVAAELGVRAIELDGRNDLPPGEIGRTAVRAIRKLLEDHRLSVAAVNFASRRGLHALDGLEARVEALKATMRLAHDLGASVVPFSVGHIPAEDELPTSWNTLVEVLSELGAYSQHVGALLAADTGAQSPDDLARLIDALPQHALGVALNPATLTGHGHAADEAAQQLGALVYHVYAGDAMYDPAARRGEQTTLGRGMVDYPALLGALEEHGYRGYFTIAATPSDTPIDETSQAIQYLQNLA